MNNRPTISNIIAGNGTFELDPLNIPIIFIKILITTIIMMNKIIKFPKDVDIIFIFPKLEMDFSDKREGGFVFNSGGKEVDGVVAAGVVAAGVVATGVVVAGVVVAGVVVSGVVLAGVVLAEVVLAGVVVAETDDDGEGKGEIDGDRVDVDVVDGAVVYDVGMEDVDD